MIDASRLRVAAAGLLVVASIGVAACGSESATTAATASTDATQRGAAAANADGKCADSSPSSTFSPRIVNALPGKVELRVPIDSFDCFDWSGVSTPYTAFNRQSLAVGQTRGFRLETYDRADEHWWTMDLRAFGTNGDVEGSARFAIKGSALWAANTQRMPDDGSLVCSFAPAGPAPSGWRDTPQTNLRPGDTRTYTLAVVGGTVGFHYCLKQRDEPKQK